MSQQDASPAAPDLSDLPQLAEARGLWDAGRLEEALAAFERVVERHPRHVKALLEAARALGMRHEIARAEAAKPETVKVDETSEESEPSEASDSSPQTPSNGQPAARQRRSSRSSRRKRG